MRDHTTTAGPRPLQQRAGLSPRSSIGVARVSYSSLACVTPSGCVWHTDAHSLAHAHMYSLSVAQVAFCKKGVRITSCCHFRARGAVGSQDSGTDPTLSLEEAVLGKIVPEQRRLIIALPYLASEWGGRAGGEWSLLWQDI